MIRPAAALLAVVLVTGCDQRAPAPPPAGNTQQGFDNSAVSQSIMQPKVIAETAPTPTPTPTPAPTGTTVLFSQGAKLDDAGRQQLDALLAAPNLPSSVAWIVRGSSDSPGSDQSNLLTSRHRAEAVRDYLVGKGVAADLITVVALGERRPVAPNARLDGSDDPTGRARNRRVDVEIVPPTSTPAPPVPEAAPANAAAPAG